MDNTKSGMCFTTNEYVQMKGVRQHHTELSLLLLLLLLLYHLSQSRTEPALRGLLSMSLTHYWTVLRTLFCHKNNNYYYLIACYRTLFEYAADFE